MIQKVNSTPNFGRMGYPSSYTKIFKEFSPSFPKSSIKSNKPTPILSKIATLIQSIKNKFTAPNLTQKKLYNNCHEEIGI